MSNITPPNFRLYTKPSCLKKTCYIIDNLDFVKKRSKFLYDVSFENTEGGPPFCAPIKFQDYTNTQISSKSQGSALAIFLEKYISAVKIAEIVIVCNILALYIDK